MLDCRADSGAKEIDTNKGLDLTACRGQVIPDVILGNILTRHSPVMPRSCQLSFKLQGRVIHRLIVASETARN